MGYPRNGHIVALLRTTFVLSFSGIHLATPNYHVCAYITHDQQLSTGYSLTAQILSFLFRQLAAPYLITGISQLSHGSFTRLTFQNISDCLNVLTEFSLVMSPTGNSQTDGSHHHLDTAVPVDAI